MAEADPDADVDLDGAGEGDDAELGDLVDLVPDQGSEEECKEAERVDGEGATLPPMKRDRGTRQVIFEGGECRLNTDVGPSLFLKDARRAQRTGPEPRNERGDGSETQGESEEPGLIGHGRDLVDTVGHQANDGRDESQDGSARVPARGEIAWDLVNDAAKEVITLSLFVG